MVTRDAERRANLAWYGINALACACGRIIGLPAPSGRDCVLTSDGAEHTIESCADVAGKIIQQRSAR